VLDELLGHLKPHMGLPPAEHALPRQLLVVQVEGQHGNVAVVDVPLRLGDLVSAGVDSAVQVCDRDVDVVEADVREGDGWLEELAGAVGDSPLPA
jgi:hypothetical protein